MIKINSTTWRKTQEVAINGADHSLEFEVGDSKSSEYHPQMKVMKWGNECNLSLRLPGRGVSSVRCDGDCVESSRGSIKFNTSGEGISIIVLKEVKELELSMRTKNVTLERQPVYTDKSGKQVEKLRSGETYYRDKKIDIMPFNRFVPLNNQGSYVVRHSLKRDGQYATGKVATLFLPTLTDAKGKESLVPFTIKRDSLTYDLKAFAGRQTPWVIE